MDYLTFLCNYPVLKRIIRDASDRTGPWRRYLFCGPLANFVNKIKEEHSEDFANCLDADGHFLRQLRSGDFSLYSEQVVNYLFLQNQGRVAVSLAFVSWLLDRCDNQNQFSPDFVLDSLCIPLWRLIKQEVEKREGGEAAQVFQEEMQREGLLPPPACLVQETPERVDGEVEDLHLAEPAVVEESSGEEESLGEEEMEEVETEADSELEVVFASENEVLSQTPDLLRLDVASGLSNSSEELEICTSQLSGIAPLASSDSSCSEAEEEEKVEPPSVEPPHRVSVIVHAPARGTGEESVQK